MKQRKQSCREDTETTENSAVAYMMRETAVACRWNILRFSLFVRATHVTYIITGRRYRNSHFVFLINALSKFYIYNIHCREIIDIFYTS